MIDILCSMVAAVISDSCGAGGLMVASVSLTELARPLLGAVTSESPVMRLTRGAFVTEALVTRVTCHVSGLIVIILNISVIVSRSVITGV